ncbi:MULTISPECIES: MarR family winged helix-turn-helix transcriptional regulator [unclassified Rhodococcus (in: high G+C Gram-positive bacteria)]|uniref:MarR family winged helix-turn-helix transcriptional regulator n=1 Tax=unclassified Rhodococcus (in: high G+C Gram-positive bacteria) TaxID=192944 RepID=UPI00146F605B|nr:MULTISPECIES: MarR family transcriptional regulator [unclassified Rhodococcus (in: high G+C Gram-positive bacteria)]MBF0663504.1 MarR family transcriptional regulator [Rhodococcus sp. (in: high G+C Gram-positive bacteria)]NMD96047.1 MarR family transcriptional regulator [Rhodococcus sp. BL-253-APC-6A1W]NME78987.1 MarR family transcriptional regulator [Rhodococcus sp. 105337]
MSDSPVVLRDLLMGATRTLRRRWHDLLNPWELSPHEHRALRVIGDTDTPIRLGVVAKALRIAPRSATEVVDRLESRGLTERLPDPADRRAVCVQLTDNGRTVLDELDAARDTDAAEVFARLDPSERADLARLLRKLVDDAPR